MRLKEVRRRWTTDNQRLRRARHLYALATHKVFMSLEPGALRDAWVNHIADAGLYRGLWSTRYGTRNERRRHARISLMHYWHKLTPGYEDSWGWWRWCDDRQLRPVKFDTKPKLRVAG